MTGAYDILRPEWLAAIPAILLLGWWLARRARAHAAWAQAVDPHLMAELGRRGHLHPASGRRILAPLALAVLVGLALSGPAVERRDAPAWRNLTGRVLVLDLSASVGESGAFGALRTAAEYLAAGAGTRRVAVVVFAGDAYVASTFTTDRGALDAVLSELDTSLIPDPGSRPERGVELAHDILATAQILAGDVIVLGDGGGIGPAAEASVAALRSDGFVTRGVGASSPALRALEDLTGEPALSASDYAALSGLASDSPAEMLAESPYAALAWRDLGRYLLALALVPAFILFRRGA